MITSKLLGRVNHPLAQKSSEMTMENEAIATYECTRFLHRKIACQSAVERSERAGGPCPS